MQNLITLRLYIQKKTKEIINFVQVHLLAPVTEKYPK